MVPGQVITQENIDFMRKLDVKEIHGYDAMEGLKLVRPEALAKLGDRHSGRTGSRLPRNKGAGRGEGDIMIDWFVQTLRSYPEIAIFLSLALGYYFGSFTYQGLGLGAVTATLIAAVSSDSLESRSEVLSNRCSSCCSCLPSVTASDRNSCAASRRTGIPQALLLSWCASSVLGAAYVGAKLAGL